ncbi:MAG: hypothetical protein K0R63_883 [Rickettsiales bacterium]|jgi:hypothetical protein|nr:hypothetical protein [Rickettsiales bacterium]
MKQLQDLRSLVNTLFPNVSALQIRMGSEWKTELGESENGKRLLKEWKNEGKTITFNDFENQKEMGMQEALMQARSAAKEGFAAKR